MINITDAAQKHFIKLLSKQQPNTQIRIFVSYPETYKSECEISYCFPENIQTSDTKLDFKYFSVYIDETSLPYLKDAEINLITKQTESQLTLKAPNINKKIQQPDHNAPLSDRIKYILQYKINPILASHGGYVTLVNITQDMSAIIQFHGGCNGCSMVDYTLKENIEKKLLKHFPELKKIYDLTDHQHGIHSFY
ncbi:NifU family protein [Blochmannia endosymbiont of Camponotus (Colobopsis) obliquus]|uniref:NifU family protein n=1 Tax=Blochmannia endosymbiont of Camponotus (Colobopsis) obliquus TaxID=1505597 RepID=UPI00061A55F6|nr:NifU family protein [Blochmannia endosymbiont of Camponotus (Colobopsis) obliquus]AKC60719.1 Fe/S biogenesis protein NfuA [Blochmannia endosymbiont of Camponotus (Colobopsis) obliquus]